MDPSVGGCWASAGSDADANACLKAASDTALACTKQLLEGLWKEFPNAKVGMYNYEVPSPMQPHAHDPYLSSSCTNPYIPNSNSNTAPFNPHITAVKPPIQPIRPLGSGPRRGVPRGGRRVPGEILLHGQGRTNPLHDQNPQVLSDHLRRLSGRNVRPTPTLLKDER